MFNININCVVFGVNELLNKRCVLSTSPTEIILPKFSLDQNQIKQLNKNIITFVKNYAFVSDLELMPQMISFNHDVLNSDPLTLETVYGFIIDYNSNIDPAKCYWIDFDPLKEHRLSVVLFDTMQKLS